MKRAFLLLLLSIIGLNGFSQTEIQNNSGENDSESTQTSSLRKDPSKKERPRPAVDLYKIISIENDTTVVDTSLTIEKFYKYNYLRKDRFALLPFANTGQTNNTLLYNFDEESTRPLFGARARHFNYMEVEDINYFEVPTPWTQLYYKSVFEQGQTLDASYTMNTSRQFNFSIAYKGLRSLGKYQNVLTSTGNFRFAFSYHTKDKRYQVRAHYVAQDLLNNENGGLTDQALQNFQSGNSQFDDRSTLAVNFQDAENILDGKRIFIDHYYELLPQQDSVSNNSLRVGHRLNFDDKFYRYEQGAPSELFGDSFQAANLRDRVDLEDFNNEISLSFANRILGKLTVQANNSSYDYGYNSVLVLANGDRIPNRIQGNSVAVGAGYEKNIKGFDLKSNAQANVSGDFDGYNLYAIASYTFKDKFKFESSLSTNSRPANYNHLLYQSSYINYNWYNADDYKNVKTSKFHAALKTKRWGEVSTDFTTIKDYAFFEVDPENNGVNSFQSGENVTYLTIEARKEFKFGKFAMNNTVAYQNVSSGGGVLNVPEIITRNSLYYTDRWFDNALFIQTGLNLKYFTKYYMNAYDPVLAEFYVQNTTQIGEFPLIDLFFNMKVRQTRIFFIAEHINSAFTGNDFFSAPRYPYRDFNFRFGVVWDFFL